MAKKLSLIIPCYKQQATIVEDINCIVEVMDNIRFDYEIIVVVDGFLDKTYEVAQVLNSSKVKGSAGSSAWVCTGL